MNLDSQSRTALFEFLLRLGDDRLVLGHRLSEWCGHAPVLEEDIALTNIALDEIGQATALLHLAGEVEAKHRSEDDLAYFREATQFRNVQLVEQPNGDFAFTVARQFFFDTYNYLLLDELQKSMYVHLAGIAAKGFKEAIYHFRHSKEWMLRLGDGTEESHRKAQDAVNNLWRFTGELFMFDEVEQRLAAQGIIPILENLHHLWNDTVCSVLSSATLAIPPEESHPVSGSRKGKHSEHLGHLLAEMQILARSYPDARW
jgi:ring-1,2-phenylacetyl-CoA epoxidase subunit PaaC